MLYLGYAVLCVCGTRQTVYTVYGVLGVCYTRYVVYSVWAILSILCTRCKLYSVYGVLGVCCTPCILYLVYAVGSVNSWSWHREIERDVWTLCFAMMVELWTRKRDGENKWERYGGFEWIWDASGTTRQIGSERPNISVLTHWIGTGHGHIWNGKLTRTPNSLKFQFLIMISPISCHVSLSRPRLYSHLSTRSYVIPLYICLQ